MKVTLVHPAIGKHEGQKNYIRTWQMEPLGAATLASLTPSEHQVKFFDDRVETIDYNEPTDLVAISVETYTAMRAYQIASEYRKRNVPVVMGGFHASLCPEEVSQYAESVVVGEAEASRSEFERRHRTLVREREKEREYLLRRSKNKEVNIILHVNKILNEILRV